LLRLLPIILVVAVLSRTYATGGGAVAFLASICVMTFAFAILMGPLVVRSDLRRDLIHLALLKAWPVDGATLVRGEVMAPAALLTAIAWVSAAGVLAFKTRLDIAPSWIVAAALISPGVIVLRLLEQNAVAVMFPSWIVTGPSRSFGIDVLGQRLLMMLGLLFVLVVAVVPAAIVGGIVGVAIYYLTGSVGVIIPAAFVAMTLFVEAYVASQIIGRLLDRTDVSAVDATEN
jgi:ABC-2 type transport system permease protein